MTAVATGDLLHQMVDVSAQLNLEAQNLVTYINDIGTNNICKDILEGDILAAACDDTVIRLWDIKTGTNTLNVKLCKWL